MMASASHHSQRTSACFDQPRQGAGDRTAGDTMLPRPCRTAVIAPRELRRCGSTLRAALTAPFSSRGSETEQGSCSVGKGLAGRGLSGTGALRRCSSILFTPVAGIAGVKRHVMFFWGAQSKSACVTCVCVCMCACVCVCARNRVRARVRVRVRVGDGILDRCEHRRGSAERAMRRMEPRPGGARRDATVHHSAQTCSNAVQRSDMRGVG